EPPNERSVPCGCTPLTMVVPDPSGATACLPARRCGLRGRCTDTASASTCPPFPQVSTLTVGSALHLIVTGLTQKEQLELYENFRAYLISQEILGERGDGPVLE